MRKIFQRLLKTLFWTLLWGIVGISLPSVYASEPSAEPILRLETGMHTAMIYRIGVDEEEHYLVTGSRDKTVRVWELKTGRLLRVLRPPVERGNEGEIYAVAISPNGEHIACGGWTGYTWEVKHSIFIFEMRSGKMKKRIAGLPNAIFHLSYSKDGRYLAASIGGKNGIRIFSTTGYKQVAKDSDYGNSSLWVDWERGRLVTACFDGYIRLYNHRFERIAKEKAPGGKEPFSACFSPNGSRIAVGFRDSTRVNVLSGQDLSFLYAPDTTAVDNGNLNSVSWSSDGTVLYAGGMYDRGGSNPIVRWYKQGKGAYTVIEASQTTIMHILPLKNGGIVFGAADPAFGIIDKTGKRFLFKSPLIADYSGMLKQFLLSENGAMVKFGYKQWGKLPAIFSINDRLLILNPSNKPDDLTAPITKAEDLKITGWRSTYSPKLNGKPLTLKDYECSRSLAISPGKKTFLLGTGWYLRFFDREGKEIWNKPAPGPTWSVNISGDGKVATAAFGDGTIRWYRLKDGKELMAFFPHNDQKRWVLWTPSGYYDASPGGEELIGWHMNRGKEKTADFFPVSRFRSSYYRPDVVTKILTTLDEKEAVLLADNEQKTRKKELDIRRMLPPVVRILSPSDGAAISSKNIKVKFIVRNPSGEAIKRVKIMIDGRPVSRERRIKVVRKGETRTARVTIPPKDCEISVIAENRYAASEPAIVRITWKSPEILVLKPKLYVLAIGVSNYKDTSLVLMYPAKDARDFVTTIKKQKGGLYSDVIFKELTDRKATKDNILDGLEWLERQVTAKDVSMVFLAGHGVNDFKGTYYFLPVDVNRERLKRTGVSFLDIKDTVSNVAGKSILFADTCHSGNIMGTSIRRGTADINALVNELASAENGVVVFTSSSGRQYALENDTWGNGAFTLALIEGLKGKADIQRKGKITITMLEYYLAERVKELTGGKQTPHTEKPKTIPDFPIAIKLKH